MVFTLAPCGDMLPLPYTEVLSRLQSEFAGRVIVSDIGEPDVDGMVAELIELKAPQQMIDDARTGILLRVSLCDYEFSDDSIVFDLTPATSSIVGHYPDGDTGTILTMLERAAGVLDYSLAIQ